jgi:hypothetical protein
LEGRVGKGIFSTWPLFDSTEAWAVPELVCLL